VKKKISRLSAIFENVKKSKIDENLTLENCSENVDTITLGNGALPREELFNTPGKFRSTSPARAIILVRLFVCVSLVYICVSNTTAILLDSGKMKRRTDWFIMTTVFRFTRLTFHPRQSRFFHRVTRSDRIVFHIRYFLVRKFGRRRYTSVRPIYLRWFCRARGNNKSNTRRSVSCRRGNTPLIVNSRVNTEYWMEGP